MKRCTCPLVFLAMIALASAAHGEIITTYSGESTFAPGHSDIVCWLRLESVNEAVPLDVGVTIRWSGSCAAYAYSTRMLGDIPAPDTQLAGVDVRPADFGELTLPSLTIAPGELRLFYIVLKGDC